MKAYQNDSGAGRKNKPFVFGGTTVKTKWIAITIFFLFSTVLPAKAAILNVQIEPLIPTTEDLITISVSGGESSGPVEITNAIFNIDDHTLELDLFLDVGFFDMITYWSYPENIGPLPLGSYDLTVRTYELGEVDDIYLTNFEVIPEPSTFLFLGVGMLALKKNK